MDHPVKESTDGEQRKTSTRENGLSIANGVYFVVGDILGAGIVTLPYTMRMVSWWGILLFTLAALLMCLCGILLAYAYIFAFENVKNREEIRDPYAQIAEKAYGRKAKLGVILTLNVSLLFVCIVFLLLLGEVFSQIAPMDSSMVTHRNQMRIWFIVCGLTLLPLTFLGTPKDFWGVGVLATVCSVVAGLLILLNLTMAGHKSGVIIPHRLKVSPETVLAVFGTVQFTFGGVLIFPTIQNDMKEPHKFPLSIIFGYLIVLVIYLCVSVVAFIVLDDKIEEDILTSFIKYSLYGKCKYFKAYTTMAQCMIAGHVLAAFILLINPVNQQLEHLFDAPFRKFSVCFFLFFFGFYQLQLQLQFQ